MSGARQKGPPPAPFQPPEEVPAISVNDHPDPVNDHETGCAGEQQTTLDRILGELDPARQAAAGSESLKIIGGADQAGLSPGTQAAITAGEPLNTRRALWRRGTDYRTWCSETGRIGIPATDNDLAEYARYLAYVMNQSPATIEQARWAILKLHNRAGVTPPPTDNLVKVLRGYRAHLAETKDPKARPRRATALTRDPLQAILTPLDRATPGGCRDAALILLSVWTAARISELAAVDIGDVEPVDGKGMHVTLYRGKVRKMQVCSVEHAADPALCAVKAVQAWIVMLASRGHITGPLFVHVDRHGNTGVQQTRNGKPIGDPSGRVTPEAIADVITRGGRRVALPGRWTGHSGRRGFATAAAQNGAGQRDIARGGAWDDNSRIVASYIDDAQEWESHPLRGAL